MSDSQIVVPVPVGATTGNVIVTVSGLASNGVSFSVAPAITALSHASGPVGTSVMITGTNFGATQGTSTVTFNLAFAKADWDEALHPRDEQGRLTEAGFSYRAASALNMAMNGEKFLPELKRFKHIYAGNS